MEKQGSSNCETLTTLFRLVVVDRYSDTWNIMTKLSAESLFRVLSTWMPREYRDVQLFCFYICFIEYQFLFLFIPGPSASVNIVIIVFAAVRSLDVWWLIRDEVSVKMDKKNHITTTRIILHWFNHIIRLAFHFLLPRTIIIFPVMFSRAQHRLRIFPRSASATCFPALGIGNIFLTLTTG